MPRTSPRIRDAFTATGPGRERVSVTVRFVSILLVGWLFLTTGVAADEPCGQAGNLIYNCNFDNFQDRGDGNSTPDGWLPWVTMGSPAFDADLHGSAPGAPAQRIWSDGGTWTAGLYQQVQVTPGKGYLARIQWAAPRCAGTTCEDIERKIGIDPSGGTDPLSPQVVWGTSCWLAVSMPDLHTSAYAEAGTITIFIWTHHPTSHGQDEVFLDGAVLIEDPAMAPRATATPTPLPTSTRMPTARPAAVQPTSTHTPLPPTLTETATLMPTDAPTETPTSTPVPTDTPTPSDTPTPRPPTNTPPPTRTPLPTIVPVAHLIADVDAGPGPGMARAASPAAQGNTTLLYVAGASLLGGLLVAGVLVWIWQRGRRAASEPGEQ